MAASVAIKYNNALDFGELSPFYDVKEEVHAYAVNAGADALRLTEQDVKSICAAIIKEIRKNRVAKIVDGRGTPECVLLSAGLGEVVGGIGLIRRYTTIYLAVGPTLQGEYDIILKMPRAPVVKMFRTIAGGPSLFKLASEYDTYFGAGTSIAFNGSGISFCVEIRNSSAGIKGKQDILIKIIYNSVLYIDLLNKYVRI